MLRSLPERLAALAAAGALMGLAACGGGDGDSAPERVAPGLQAAQPRDPGADPRARVALPPRGRWFGFNEQLAGYEGHVRQLDQGHTFEASVADAMAAGANSMRVPVVWADLEPVRGRYHERNAARMDRFIAALEQRGGRALLVITATPGWAAGGKGRVGIDGPRGDPETVAAFGRFAAFLVRRWPRIVAIETWNEPNTVYAWAPRPDPEAYARLHRAAAEAVRAVAPRMPVLVGGLTLSDRDTATEMRPQRFLKRMYTAGLRPSDYDGLALHVYPRQRPDGVVPLSSGREARGLEDFRLGHEWVDPEPPLWVTETGVTTSGPAPATPAGQARGLQTLVRSLFSLPRVRGVWLHTLFDHRYETPSSPERGFGVLEPAGAQPGRPKPAFCALRALAADPPPHPGC